jgi:hypothetical protein
MRIMLWGSMLWDNAQVAEVHEHMTIRKNKLLTWDCSLETWHQMQRKQKTIYHLRTFLIYSPLGVGDLTSL